MGEPPIAEPKSSEARSASPLLDASNLPWLASAVLTAIGLRLLWINYVSVDPNDGRFADAVYEKIAWKPQEPEFHLFSIGERSLGRV